jgi:hypothetical protein
MPLIKIDYNETMVQPEAVDELVQLLLGESSKIYGYTPEEGKDKVSIFTAAYGHHVHSTAAAEIEVRAKLAEYDKPGVDPNALRQQHMDAYQDSLKEFIAKHALPAGLVFTITFEDWQVVWLAGVGSA